MHSVPLRSLIISIGEVEERRERVSGGLEKEKDVNGNLTNWALM